MNIAYELNDISFSYYKSQSLFVDLSLKIKSNTLTAVIGPNGSGKSTFLRILCRLLKPTKGEIKLLGTSIEEYNRRDLAKKIAILPQTISPLFSLSVEDVIALGRFPHKMPLSNLNLRDRKIINDCVNKMGLTALKGRRIEALSAGEFKKTVIASILAQEPEILLLDEPLSGLDTPFQLELLTLLQELKSSGLTIILTTHEINVITRFADEVLLFSNSHSLIGYGPPNVVLNQDNLLSAYNCKFWIGNHPLTNSILVEPLIYEK
ncbi:MAG: ABC transporter ATP-binding protein [Candidatus Hydrogenedentes bacterium]|nr:ABC transporter ATP-binding protein [Candidatus Hydrogenedentota bacterium]